MINQPIIHKNIDTTPLKNLASTVIGNAINDVLIYAAIGITALYLLLK